MNTSISPSAVSAFDHPADRYRQHKSRVNILHKIDARLKTPLNDMEYSKTGNGRDGRWRIPCCQIDDKVAVMNVNYGKLDQHVYI